MKKCSTCKAEKELSFFHIRKDVKSGYSAQCKSCRNSKIMEAHRNNPESTKQAKRRYYASEKGKAQKRKEETAYVESGGRAKAEARRAERPLSEPRKNARLKYAVVKRTADKDLSELDIFVLSEAISLAKLREKMLGIKWHVDHIIPVSKGGASNHDNIQVVPALWNRRKSNKHTGLFFARA